MSGTERPNGDAGWARSFAAVFAVAAVLLVVVTAPAILARRYPDPDDVLRMVQVRDLLAGQGWFDLTQHRIDAPSGGVAMHWSRLVDVPLALAILLLSPLFGQPQAETIASVAIPMATLGCALALVGRQAARLTGPQTAFYACLALCLSVPMLAQVMPLRIDHHGWQIVTALAVVAGLTSRDQRRGGWITGAALAVWLAISLEGLPLAAATCGIMALRWLSDPRDKGWFVHTVAALATGSLVLFVATRGLTDLSNHCDALSPVHLAVFAWAAIAALMLARLDPPARTPLLAGLAAIAAGGAALLLALAPQCAVGGFAGMDPLVERFWYRGVAEGQPLWNRSTSLILLTVVPPLTGLAAIVSLRRDATEERRALWTDYALLLAAALAVAILVTRAGGVAGAIAAIPVGWQIGRWFVQLGAARMRVKAAVALAVLAGAALIVLPGRSVIPPRDGAGVASPSAARAPECRVAEAAPLLAAMPRGEILAPLDLGPRLLIDSPHTVIASAHHRGQPGMRFAIEVFLGSPKAGHEALASRGTAYVALCPGISEVAHFVAAAPDGLLAQLAAGREFAWLEPLPVPAGSNLKVWRIST